MIGRFVPAVLLALLTWVGSVQALEVGEYAPNLIARTLTGQLFALKRAPQKPKVLNFFWVECVPCQRELPELAELERQYPGVMFYAVHAEANPQRNGEYHLDEVQTFINTLAGAPITTALAHSRVKELFGVKAMPWSLLLSADNRVEAILKGYNEQTQKQLKQWLAAQ